MGESAVDAAKKVERRVKQSQALLERMTRERERVLEALGPAERDEVMEELHVLVGRATRVRRGSELLDLTNDVLALVKNRPALRKQFPVTSRRSGTRGDIDSILSEIQVLEYANQITNSVQRLGQAVDQELQKLSKQGSDDDRR
jgi:hypothetical protein